jgi:hypothetical protein
MMRDILVWWRDWDAGPLIRLILWAAVALGLLWRHTHVNPFQAALAGLGWGAGVLLVSCTLFQVLLYVLCGAVHVYFLLDDLLYGLSERVVLALWRPRSRLAFLSATIALEFGFVAFGLCLLGLGGKIWPETNIPGARAVASLMGGK